MKNLRTSTLVSFLLVAVWLAPAQQSTAARESALQEEIVARERRELDALKAGDAAAFADLLADDAVFVDARGTAGKAEVVSHVADIRLRDYAMSGLRFVLLSPDSGLIAYQLTQSGTSHGRDFTAQVYASALWVRRQGRWLCLFSQETAARQRAPG